MTFHFGNIFFELDLDGRNLNINQLLKIHPNFYQLQFLPFLYKNEDEQVLVSNFPDSKLFKNCLLLEDLKSNQKQKIELWGNSDCINFFSNYFDISNQPCHDTTKLISKKTWLLPYIKKYLPEAKLISTADQLSNLFSMSEFSPFVLKQPDGFSARGNIVILKKEDLSINLLNKLLGFLISSPLIYEPWMERSIDFSTQWNINGNNITCLGATQLLNSIKGGYQGNIFDPCDPFLKKNIPEIEVHYKTVIPLLQEIQHLGFTGNLGVDAFFYVDKENYYLQPIVEINPRKTMGYVCVKIAENNRFECPILLKLQEASKCSSPLLPSELRVQHKQLLFKKNLEIQKVPGVLSHASFENTRGKTFKWHY